MNDDRVTRLRRFFAALESMHPSGPAAVEQLHTALELVPVTVQHFKETPMHLVESVLTPPTADPTREPRRTERPRLLVATSEALFLRLPAAAPENLLGRVGRRSLADWHVLYLAEDPLDDGCLGTYPSPRAAFASLDHHLHEQGLVEDVVEPGTGVTSEGGAFDAA